MRKFPLIAALLGLAGASLPQNANVVTPMIEDYPTDSGSCLAPWRGKTLFPKRRKTFKVNRRKGI